MTKEFSKGLIRNRKEVMAKFNSARQAFKKKEKRMRTDLEEASRTWKELGERFKWWQSLP